MSCFLFTDDEDSRGKVNIDELYERNRRRDLNQVSIFNKILNRIQNRIKTTAANKYNNEKHIWYQVPAFIFGEKVYDQTSCIAYVVSKLEDNGFFIKYVHPGTLFISWENWVPAYARNEIKKRTGLILDEHGTIIGQVEKKEESANDIPINAGPGSGSSSSDASAKNTKQYKSITEYKPTGNLVYGKDALENLEKKVVKFNL